MNDISFTPLSETLPCLVCGASFPGVSVLSEYADIPVLARPGDVPMYASVCPGCGRHTPLRSMSEFNLIRDDWNSMNAPDSPLVGFLDVIGEGGCP